MISRTQDNLWQIIARTAARCGRRPRRRTPRRRSRPARTTKALQTTSKIFRADHAPPVATHNVTVFAVRVSSCALRYAASRQRAQGLARRAPQSANQDAPAEEQRPSPCLRGERRKSGTRSEHIAARHPKPRRYGAPNLTLHQALIRSACSHPRHGSRSSVLSCPPGPPLLGT